MAIVLTKKASEAVDGAYAICNSYDHEFFMPEHLLLSICHQKEFAEALMTSGGNAELLRRELEEYVSGLETIVSDKEVEDEELPPAPSVQMRELLRLINENIISSSATEIDVPHLVNGITALPESMAAYMLAKNSCNGIPELLSALISSYEGKDMEPLTNAAGEPDFASERESVSWRDYVVCINDILYSHNPLIGRDEELERTVQVLCRKDKNNPLHVGEPGVGKTALVFGLARRIEDNEVPSRLLGSRIYSLDVGTLLAGTQFRGDFEKRIKLIMDGISKEENAIVYIDEIHTLVGAGATGDGSMDASNMLKPYLEDGKIRFIGATTYEEYNRYFAKSKSLVRRFQQIDIPEPSVDETYNIAIQLRPAYEAYHNVEYTDEALRKAVEWSGRHISDRFFPDKVLDLLDEAGAYREIHPLPDGSRIIDTDLISEILAKVCKIKTSALVDSDNSDLDTLYDRIAANVYGQEDAVRTVTEAVQMAKAGLNESTRPLANLLFVGPTGVGKTEVARTLASELGIELLRFDMSEYSEKHAVAKLIGAPAGYVGYDDGGRLTDDVRRSPNSVLLLDEIEKAHPDIYNILLQVMDYGRLTDNKGRHADFRNVILIMTSNAGAQFASKGNVGFMKNRAAGDLMLKQVKSHFKPEFLNRLSGTVIFRDMDTEMARLILHKKIRVLNSLLKEKNVTLTLTEAAEQYILHEGFSAEYGARELDRVVSSRLKSLLMRQILFGSLKTGGDATVDYSEGELRLL